MYKKYIKSDLENALKEVSDKTLSIYKAANKYYIPPTTLKRKVKAAEKSVADASKKYQVPLRTLARKLQGVS